MASWTRTVIRHRKKILLAWLVVFVLAGTASAGLADLLTNRFAVPGSDAQKGFDLVKNRMGDNGQGAFTLVFETAAGSTRDPAFARAADAAAQRAANTVKGGKPGALIRASDKIAYVQ